MWAVIVKEFEQLRRDHRTAAMLIVIPVVLLVVFGYAASFDVLSFRVALYGPQAQQVVGLLPPGKTDIVVVDPSGGDQQAQELLQRGDAVVAIVTGQQPEIYVDGADLFGARAAVAAFSQMPNLPAPTILFNPELKTSVIMVPAIIGMILVFVGTIATSLGVVRERQAGTLEMLAVMPLRARDVFIGKIAPYFTVALIDAAVIVILGLLLFGVPFNGSPAVFLLGAVLFLFVTTGFGILISTVSQNQGQAIQLAFMALLPQILLSGMIFPLDSIPAGIRWISYLLPLTYFVEIARGVIVRGAPLDAVALPLAALAIMAVLIFGFSVSRFQRDLSPAGGGGLRARLSRRSAAARA